MQAQQEFGQQVLIENREHIIRDPIFPNNLIPVRFSIFFFLRKSDFSNVTF